MDAKSFIKLIVVLFAVVAILPFALKMLPESVKFDAVQHTFEQSGFTVEGYTEASAAELGAVRQASFQLISGANTPLQASLYEFDNEGKIATQYEYNKPDPGPQMVEMYNLSDVAAGMGQVRQQRPVGAGRNGKLLLVVTGDSKELVKRAVDRFEAL